MARGRRAWLAGVAVALVAGSTVVALGVSRPVAERVDAVDTDLGPEAVERGAYLARVANCSGCHTRPGGEHLAGGRRLETDFGEFTTPNITADPDAGIGDWSRDAFRAALLGGRRADGAPLYPACPYPSFTHARPVDVDAVYAYLQATEPVEQEADPHALDFPFGMRWLVNVWQWAFFEPGGLEPAQGRGADWARGRYLVEGLGHCSGCHKQRNGFGATRAAATAPGGHVDGWYAPSLHSVDEAGLQGLSVARGARFLRSGKLGDRTMLGPMAGVVFESLQHLSSADARAMATYLQALPDTAVTGQRAPIRPSKAALERQMATGQRLYGVHCADCHGEAGEGSGGAVALAGNRTVTLPDPANVIRMIREGGYPAATEGHPYPHGMPPFPQLNDREIAAITSYIRRSWGNHATPVTSTAVAE